MSLIYGEGKKADICRQVPVLHMYTFQRAEWTTRSQKALDLLSYALDITQHLLHNTHRGEHTHQWEQEHKAHILSSTRSSVLQRQNVKHCVLYYKDRFTTAAPFALWVCCLSSPQLSMACIQRVRIIFSELHFHFLTFDSTCFKLTADALFT